MTLAFFPPPAQPQAQRRVALGGHDVRRGLTALLRRRVPQQEVEDVAQTVLCDALASDTLPSDPEELRRWLTGIARHKIADFHRRAARTNARTADAEPDEIAFERPSAFEEREVLHLLLGEVRSRREAETMEWLVREHAGERLADIANEQGVPAPVVRQRVSRLRRAIRSRWTGVFGLVALLAGLSALGLAAYDPREAIVPDPVIASHVPTAPASASPLEILSREAEGDWVVQTVTPNRPLAPAEMRLVELEAKGATLRVHGKTIELEAMNFKTHWRITGFEKTSQGARVKLTSDAGHTDSADVVFRRDARGPRLDVTLHHPRFGGTVALRRPVL